MKNTLVELKGKNFTLSVVYLKVAQPNLIYKALIEKISQAPDFFKNAPVVVNVSNVTSPIDWKLLQKAVTDTGLKIIGISGCKDNKIRSEIERAGLSLLTEGNRKNKTYFTKTRLIDTLVRSGKCIYAPNSDLIVTNHVSSGAELIADGNIHVYGILRGRVLAGAKGNKAAQIFCSHLISELISIAGKYWTSDQIPSEFYGKAVRFRLINNNLIVQLLN